MEKEKEGGKYLVKENIFFGGEEKQRRNRRKCLEKENISFYGGAFGTLALETLETRVRMVKRSCQCDIL